MSPTTESLHIEPNVLLGTPKGNRVRLSPENMSPSPSKSPGRRGIIKLEALVNNEVLISPFKTPNGRAGLPSPQKRSERELDQSAHKRASKAYIRLMEEEDGPEDDLFLKQQELDLAEMIIEESKRSETTDAEEPPSVPVTPQKRKRGRPKKSEVAAREAQRQKEILELTPRRRERRAVVERRLLEQQEREELRLLEPASQAEGNRVKYEDDDSDLDDEIDFEEELEDEIEKIKSPKKRLKKEKPTPKEPSERRTKKGRPSKQEKVTGKVHSIFQMDDLAFFQDSIKPEKSPIPSPQRANPTFLNFDNNGESTYSYIPTISGILEPEPQVEEEVISVPKFEPLPVPELDDEGEIKDEQYVKKYFPNSQILSNFAGRLTDERAFFLEGSEGYFEQHNLRFRPSSSALMSKAPTLEYEEFIPMVKLGSLIHSKERTALYSLHQRLYNQWCFELSQGYNLNLYGVGSKINLILDFVNEYLLEWYEKTLQEDDEYPVVMVVNGYNPSTKLKTVVHDITSAIITPEVRKQNGLRMPKHVLEAFPFLIRFMKKQLTYHKNGLAKVKLILVVHNIDGEPFRDERSQNLLSQLAALPDVWLITSTDNISSSLLWDLYRFKNFNFLWHDTTTYEPYSVEMSFKDVLSMGRSKKFVGSKGAKWVLSSLSSNAKNLYRILLQMQLKVLEEHLGTKSGRTGLRANVKLGVEFKNLYSQCIEEYVTSNEMSFRSILGEYVEHKMCSLTKNASGTEVVFVPFTYDELGLILKEEFQIGEEKKAGE